MARSEGGKLRAFLNDRWLVFVVSMWIQCCAGIGYMFGSISPIIKTAMGYNQRQVAMLGVAKDLGDSVGFIAGSLSEIMPFWAILTVGILQNFFGYGFVWLIVTNRLPALPLWVLCVAIFVGTNGETYFNTAALVSCVQNFPKTRGPIVGILKGFAGLSGAVLTQLYHIISSSNEASLILMIAIVPSLVVFCLMFTVRYVEGHRQVRPSDGTSFTFIYGVCLILAAYLMGILIFESEASFSFSLIIICSSILFFILLLPLIIPVQLAFFAAPPSPMEQSFLIEHAPGSSKLNRVESEMLLSEVESEAESEDERKHEEGIETVVDRKKRIAHLEAKLVQAAAEGAVRVKRRRGPRRGENFTLWQALVKADFWLMFVSMIIAAGSGVTIIDNMGQISQSLGYEEASIFVSMISIWNFLGRVGGGYCSELIVRNYAYPRPVAMAVFQAIMAVGLLYFAMGWPGSMYIVTLLSGLGYGAHWAIVPAAISELFGLKSFGALYNFLTISVPIGSLLFSGVIASNIYEYYAEKQAGLGHPIHGEEANTCTGTICYSLTCAILSALLLVAIGLSLLVVRRTRSVYGQLYSRSRT